MDGLYVEHRILGQTSISRDIARHLYARQLPGLVLIVVDRPAVMLAGVCKLWAAVRRQTERAWASTLNSQRKQEMEHLLRNMREMRFISKAAEVLEKRTTVRFITEAECLAEMPLCHTMYVVNASHPEKLAATVMPHGLVVLYEAG